MEVFTFSKLELDLDAHVLAASEREILYPAPGLKSS